MVQLSFILWLYLNANEYLQRRKSCKGFHPLIIDNGGGNVFPDSVPAKGIINCLGMTPFSGPWYSLFNAT